MTSCSRERSQNANWANIHRLYRYRCVCIWVIVGRFMDRIPPCISVAPLASVSALGGAPMGGWQQWRGMNDLNARVFRWPMQNWHKQQIQIREGVWVAIFLAASVQPNVFFIYSVGIYSRHSLFLFIFFIKTKSLNKLTAKVNNPSIVRWFWGSFL